MRKTGPKYGLTLSNIPIINLRWEFDAHRRLMADPTFRQQFRVTLEPIQTPYLIWLGMPGALLTLLVVRAVLGIESYIPFAVIEEAAARGRLNQEFGNKVRHPFSLSRRTADAYYNRLPSLLDEGFALSGRDPDLWNWMDGFYREVRNPLLHGHELDSKEVDQVALVFEQLAATYSWVDGWSPVENWTRDPSQRNRKRPSGADDA